MSPRWTAHWPEYAAEAFGLGLFMVSACGFAVLLFHPASPVVGALPDMVMRGALMGLAMGLTAILNIYSPWGRRSGAHLNPAVTLTFFRLGKVAERDVVGYVLAQFAGGIVGTGTAVVLFRPWVGDPSVNYVVTVPGRSGAGVAFAAEFIISFFLILVILSVSSRPSLARFTGLVAGFMVALYITLEAPLSGMSMNPARTVGSAAFAEVWTGLWLYFIAPPLGMLAAAELFRAGGNPQRRFCAKLHHDDRLPCIFCDHHAR
jgi:aquaporin Z